MKSWLVIVYLVFVHRVGFAKETTSLFEDFAKLKTSITEAQSESVNAPNPQQRLIAQQRAQTAITQVINLGNENSTDAQAQTAVSNVLLETGHADKAVTFAEHAVVLAPNDPNALFSRAQVRFEQKDYPGALADAEKTFALDPANEKAHALVALLKKNVHTVDGARLKAGATVGANSSGPGVHIRETEIEVPQPSNNSSPEQIQSLALLRQAMALSAIGDHAGAAALAEKAIAIDPGNVQARLQRALSLLAMGKNQDAAKEAGNAIAEGYDRPLVFAVRGLARLRADMPREAAEDASKAIAKDPRYAKAYWVRAQAREALGWPDDALADYKQAKELAPDYTAEFEAALARLSSRSGLAKVRVPDDTRRNWILAGLGTALVAGLLVFLGLQQPDPPPITDLGLRPTNTPLPVPKNYRLGGVIGQGGMGTVWEAEDLALHRKVAIKRLRSELRKNPKEYARFLEEARIVASLRHPNIVAIHSIIELADETLLVFELLPGRTLDRLLRGRQGLMPPPEALALLGQMAEAVDYAHAREVAHLDLKPSNVMVDPEGRAVVMDFGIARQAKDTLNALTRTALGTPLYMAPEQEEGKGGPAADRFALACIAYELLTGAQPFPNGSFTSKRERRFEDPRARRPGLPQELFAFFRKALDPDPAGRFSTAAGMIAELRGLLSRPLTA